MILIKIIIAFLIGSGLDIAVLKLVFSVYVLFEFFIIKKGWKTKINTAIWSFLIFFVIGSTNSIYQMYWGEYEILNTDNFILRIRFYFIEIIFGICVYLFFKNRPVKYLFDILFYSIILNSIVGLIQFCLNPTERLQMLFSEPSAAGFFYCFIIFITLAKYKETKITYIISRIYTFLGILIFSKGQLLSLGLVQLFKASIKLKIVLLFVLIIIISQLLDYVRLIGDKFDQIVNLYVNLSNYGIDGLNEKYKVWSSFVTRISAIYLGLLSLFENPMGLGFGGFNSYYVNWIRYSGVDLASIETDQIKEGTKYATPRSHLLELFISCGIISIFLYIKIFFKFYKIRKQHAYLYISFISLNTVAFMLELNPFFCYLGILLVLYDKELEKEVLNTSKT
jgi:hypothetical protein